jgi:hypothetical protein
VVSTDGGGAVGGGGGRESESVTFSSEAPKKATFMV